MQLTGPEADLLAISHAEAGVYPFSQRPAGVVGDYRRYDELSQNAARQHFAHTRGKGDISLMEDRLQMGILDVSRSPGTGKASVCRLQEKGARLLLVLLFLFILRCIWLAEATQGRTRVY